MSANLCRCGTYPRIFARSTVPFRRLIMGKAVNGRVVLSRRAVLVGAAGLSIWVESWRFIDDHIC
jgi:hypothetical protein